MGGWVGWVGQWGQAVVAVCATCSWLPCCQQVAPAHITRPGASRVSLLGRVHLVSLIVTTELAAGLLPTCLLGWCPADAR